jgi:hypothetical protein
MPDLILVPPAEWGIREPGVLEMIGTEHITIILNLTTYSPYEVMYRGKLVADGSHKTLTDAKARAMMLPALLLDFGMEA